MNRLSRFLTNVAEGVRLTWLLLVAGLRGLVEHWALASFSLVAAFAIWVLIQDVENPRVRGIVPEPPATGVAVRAVNVPAGLIVLESPTVRVEVEARQDVLPELRAGDFEAIVDVQGLEPGGPLSLPVRVTSKREGVDVVRVIPERVEITLIQAASKELPVEVNLTGGLPSGYVLAEPPTVEPAFVTVTGHPELVENVTKVQLDVNLSGVRDPTYVVEGELVPRSDTGAVQQVILSATRARATFKIEQRFSQRTVAVQPILAGAPAPGYRVATVTVDPPALLAIGPIEIVQGLTVVTTEPIELTGATATVTRSVAISVPSNISLDRTAVRVEVAIAPVACTDGESPCALATLLVAPSFTDVPEGTLVSGGPYQVTVKVSGTAAAIAALAPDQVGVTVSLAGRAPGVHTVLPDVALPSGITLVEVSPVAVTLVPAPGGGP